MLLAWFVRSLIRACCLCDVAASCDWSQVSTGHSFPSPRSFHSIVCSPPVMLTGESAAAGYPQLLVFGGVHTMYCTNDVWQLRVRRRRARFYDSIRRHTDAIVDAATADGTVAGVPLSLLDASADASGSDDEDWVVAEPEPTPVSSDTVDDAGPESTGIVQWRGGDGTRGMLSLSATHVASSALFDLQATCLQLKKELIRSQEQTASEVSRRRRVEAERDAVLLERADALAKLESQRVQHARERATLEAEVCVPMAAAALLFSKCAFTCHVTRVYFAVHHQGHECRSSSSPGCCGLGCRHSLAHVARCSRCMFTACCVC